MNKTNVSLKPLENSVLALTHALTPKNELERDGTIQRFEFTFELAWKTLAKVLGADRPLEDNSVKGILREAGKQGLIESVEKWFEFQQARNLTSHTYDQRIAEQVFQIAIQLPRHAHFLLGQLRKRLE